MTPMQQILLGVGAKKKTYIDDVFSTYLYKGNASSRSIVNGIDLAGEGGLIWTKSRSTTWENALIDTVRGQGKEIQSSSSGAETYDAQRITGFNSNGFDINTSGRYNENNTTYSSWSFRKAPGFFDIVTWTGDGTNNRSISHSLGSVPGMIMVKVTSMSDNWLVWHKDNTGAGILSLDTDGAQSGQAGLGTSPTSTTFTVNNNDKGNGNGQSYVAYLFAGGESTATTARSVTTAASTTTNYSLSSTSSDFNTGTGDFTYECWVKLSSNNWGSYQSIGGTREDNGNDSNGWTLGAISGDVYLYSDAFFVQSSDSDIYLTKGTWNHVAIVNHSSTLKLFVNGALADTYAMGSKSFTNQTFRIFNCAANSNQQLLGEISNARFVKGQAIYTAAFRPTTQPLTTTSQGATSSNVKLLCCQNSSTTATTVGGTLTETGNAGSTLSTTTDSPFDDPAAFTFGDAGDQGIIKCGMYTGNGSTSTPPEINFGWEPQLLITKRIDSSGNWHIYDSIRGLVTDSDDALVRPNNDDAEEVSVNAYDLTPTGFKVRTSYTHWNADGGNYIYVAVRRPDGYVGKPADAGTDVFAMDTGAGSSTIPNYDSTFPVDFAFHRQYNDTSSWNTSARLISTKKLVADTNAAEATDNNNTFDSNVGWCKNNGAVSNFQSWMWKRHAGFDVVAYTGNGVGGRQIPHNLSKTPEMMWVKSRSSGSEEWIVYHKGLNGGTNPEQKFLYLNQTTYTQGYPFWNNTAPTSTHFTVGDHDGINKSNDTFLAMLFSSVDGISKCGFYDGSSSAQTITTGFQPRFVIIKKESGTDGWIQLDTLRGWGSGDDYRLMLDSNAATSAPVDYGAPTSTGFTVNAVDSVNGNNNQYIYYAHA